MKKRLRFGEGLVLAGRALLRTLNFYVPPPYRRDGNPLPRGTK